MKSTDIHRSPSSFLPGAPASIGRHSDGALESFERLAHRIRNEYLEMPGLSLTLGQAQRMWQLRYAECEDVLGALVDAGFLTRTPGGAFVRAGSGRAGA